MLAHDAGRSGKPLTSLEHEVELRRIAAELSGERNANRVAREQLSTIRPVYEEMRHVVATMQDTKFWRLRQAWFALKHRLRLSPVGSAPRYDPPPIDGVVPNEPYERWRIENEYRDGDRRWMEQAGRLLPAQPKFSVLVPTYNTPEAYLRAMIDSVLDQVYSNWELCLADDASTASHMRAILDEYAAKDERIKIVYRRTNGHISESSNSALEIATGEYCALLDHDDLLSPDALFQNAVTICNDPSLDMIYSDEDKIDDWGRRLEPYFKPEWSPDTFLSRMYTCHLGVYRTEIMRAVGGFRTGYEGSQDYDLVLRITEHTDKIAHIPRVLYHWRIHDNSTTAGMGVKPYATDAAVRAIDDAIHRRGEPGHVIPSEIAPGTYTVRYEIKSRDRVSVVVPTRDHGDDVDRCLRSLFSLTQYENFEVILLDNGTEDFRSGEIFAAWKRNEPERLRIIRHDVPFNYSEINNYAVAHTTGRYLLFLNNDTEIIDGSWMGAMVEQAQRPSIGAVGAKLLYGDEKIQHAGVVIGIGGIAGHSHRFQPRNAFGYFNAVCAVTNFSAVTAACLMMRRDVFAKVNGFDDGLKVAYNDVDLCLRIVKQGYRIVYLPHVELFHYESKSRGYDVTPAQIDRDREEQRFMESRWGISRWTDPCYSPNLTLMREDFGYSP